jgi:hypothetical protein
LAETDLSIQPRVGVVLLFSAFVGVLAAEEGDEDGTGMSRENPTSDAGASVAAFLPPLVLSWPRLEEKEGHAHVLRS